MNERTSAWRNLLSFLSIPLALACASCALPDAPGQEAAGRWYKGNLHTHSFWSDGDDFPEMIALWYRDRGYHFLALSDHNILSEGERWMNYRDMQKRGAAIALTKYRERFPEKLATRGDEEAGTLEVRLRPLEEFRREVERPGEFIMIQSEEISDRFEELPIHINATNIAELIKPQGGDSVQEVMRNNIRAVEEQAQRLGRLILPHLNHPNFGWAITAEDMAAVIEEHFFEVYNGHPAINQMGDAQRPSVERMWDIANTIRLARLQARPLMGIATDDTHNYHVSGMSRSSAGRGWVMVRSAELTPESLIDAMKRGDFYSSSGVTLRDVHYDPAARELRIHIQPDRNATFTTQFIGTPADFDADGTSTLADSDKVGMVFATVKGLTASYRLTGNELYIRALVTSDQPADNPSYEGQLKQAWTQPVGWER